MPYGCTVEVVEGSRVTLLVEAEQPDCEPFYVDTWFAVGLLLDDAGRAPLWKQLGEDAIDELAAGVTIDPDAYIHSITATIAMRGSVAEDRAPIARYVIEVSDPKWIGRAHKYTTYAWRESADTLPEDDLWEVAVALPVASFAIGSRASLHADLAMAPGHPNGRGTVEDTAETADVPRGWGGGRTIHLVALDHGPRVWAFAESLRVPPRDHYECAWADPDGFLAELVARAPLERARSLRWLAVQSGGDTRIGDVAIAGSAAYLYGIARRATIDAHAILATMIVEWITDPASLLARYTKAFEPDELATGHYVTIGAYEIACPLELVLGALTMLLAERPRRLEVAGLEAALESLSAAIRIGYPPSVWTPRVAYIRAATELPSWILRGRDGEPIVTPSESDRYRP